MNKNTQKTLFSSDKNFWETPQALFNELNEKYHFTLDAAASHGNHKVGRYYTAEDSGLEVEFLEGRLAFELDGEPMRDEKGHIMKAPFPSMLVEFKSEDR